MVTEPLMDEPVEGTGVLVGALPVPAVGVSDIEAVGVSVGTLAVPAVGAKQYSPVHSHGGSGSRSGHGFSRANSAVKAEHVVVVM
jgi:hypothetical protein